MNLEDILSERGACGVGFIANLDNKALHEIVNDTLLLLVAWNIVGVVEQITIQVMVLD